MRNACDPRSTHEVDEGETDAVANGEKVLFLLLLGKVVSVHVHVRLRARLCD